MASSSSWDHNKSYQYDVYLSFCGEDTRKTFIDHLYSALDHRGICTFNDDERFLKGKKINDELLQSIENSRLYIIVFSKRYAFSSLCLNELLKIMDCHKSNKHTAFPVFYDVDPSEVRKQSGLVGQALATHKNESKSKIEEWREALQKVANLSGWTANGHESEVIKSIVERISLELRSINMGVDDNLVGMEKRMQDLDSCLEIGSNDIHMIGIKGIGGAGKTTLAQAIFDKISNHFDGKSFVENVREKASKSGLEKLQEQVLQDVLKDKVLGSYLWDKDASEWASVLKRLKPISLIEIDKILELSYESLEDDHKEIFLDVACFLRDWKKEDAIRMLESCGFDAKVGLRVLEQKSLIITSKDNDGQYIQMHNQIVEMGKYIVCGEYIHEPNQRSRLWVQEEIEHVLASNLVNEATRCIQLEITPHIALERLGNMKALRCLIVNYNRHVKIDEACIYFPNSLQYLRWDHYPHWHLPKTFKANNLVALEMAGSNITQLWEGGKVMKNLKFLNLSFSKLRSLDLGMTPNLEWLDLEHCYDLVEVCVHGGCLKSLVYLNLSGCKSLKSFLFIERFESLKVIHMEALNMMELMAYITIGHSNNSLLELHLLNYSLSSFFIEVPSSIENLHELISLTLYNVKSLPGTICTLRHLRTLSLPNYRIEELPKHLDQLECLEKLDLTGAHFKHFPRNICMLKRLKTLLLRRCLSLKKLHEDVGELESLEILDLGYCINLRVIPNNICKLKRLKQLDLERCERLEKIVEGLGDLECLQLLNIKHTGITRLPPNIHLLKDLKIYTSDEVNSDLLPFSQDLSSISIPSMACSTSRDHKKSYRYDVFLSFNSEDIRKTFIDHLYVALDQQSICTFKDDERLHDEKKTSDELLQSIEDSRLYIIVFSKHYVSSSRCLNELLKIMECHKRDKHTAFPVFYDVDPSEVLKQSELVGVALARDKYKSELEVKKWTKALQEAANLSGWDVRKTADGHEAKVIKLIVERVLVELDVYVDDNLIGMGKRMQDLDSCLEIGLNDIRMIGIKGVRGAGKTTLARAIFEKISIHFEGKSFVKNVREKASQSGLEKLQEQVLIDVLKDKDIIVSDVREGKKLIKNKLYGKKVLVVLDDVDDIDQLEMLAGDTTWFMPGSRIIITTRDEHVLQAHQVKWIRDVNLLTEEEAICLFSRHAFGKDSPSQEYEKHSLEVVSYAAGLPLTIKVFGSNLRGKDASEWADVLKSLKTVMLNETLKTLEVSYENLEDDHKEIFLDVACFFRDWKKEDAIRILESCGFDAKVGLRVLEQKSLIRTSKDNYGQYIQIHDHIVEMGKNIVCRGHASEPNKRSRLWAQEEIEHVLASDLVNEATRCIQLEITPHIALERLGNMKTLRCLIVNYSHYNDHVKIDEAHPYFPNSLGYLYWYLYPHWHLPKTFEANNLVSLEMPSSNIKQLWEGRKVMKKLKFLNLSWSKLRSLDLETTPNLKWLDLKFCDDLVEVYVHGECLKSLVYINLSGCKSLKSFLFIKQFESLEVIHMDDGLNTMELMDYITTGPSNNSLLELHLSNYSFSSFITEVPSSIGNLHKLVSLTLYNVKSLPGSICTLRHLRTLSLSDSRIEELPEDLGQLECLEKLDLTGARFKHFPHSICMLRHLKTLVLRRCLSLEKLHDDVGQLESMEILDLSFCYNLRDIPSNICKLKRLKQLNLESCERLEEVVEGLGDLECLQLLNIKHTGITHIPPNIRLLKGLKIYTS